MIWFNNHASWNSANYEIQKLFMNNVGDRVVPSTATGTPALSRPDHRRRRPLHLGDDARRTTT